MRATFRFIGRAPLLCLPMLVGCGDESGERALAGMPDFCQQVLPQVEAYLSGFDQPSGERYGGTAVVGGGGEIAGGMNALVSADYSANQHQQFVNLLPLIRMNSELELEPYLAREWEVDDETTQLTFRLREDVYWHDGTQTTAHDVEFTWLRAIDPETAFPNIAFWTNYEQGAEAVEVIDDFTIRFRLRPHADFMDPWRATSIMPRHLLEDVPPAELRQHPYGSRCPVGNGPFVFVEHRPEASWTFRRNPGFPEGLGGPPYLDRYVYRVIPESTTLLAELLTEQVDFYIAPPPEQASRIESANGIELRDFEFRQLDFVGWNSRRPVLADPAVRRALTLGTNRREIVEALLDDYGTVANAGVPPFHWAYDEAVADSLHHDPVAARRLLDEAGWSEIGSDGIRINADGERLEISIEYNAGSRPRQSVAEIMQAQLREIGVAVRPGAVEYATLLGRVTDPDSREFDGVVLGWVTEFKVDEHDLFHSEKRDAPYGWAGTSDPRLDQLLDTLQLIVDRDEARPLWSEYQHRVMALQPYTFLYFPRRLAGINDRLRGVRTDARGEWVSIRDWWIPAGERTR